MGITRGCPRTLAWVTACLDRGTWDEAHLLMIGVRKSGWDLILSSIRRYPPYDVDPTAGSKDRVRSAMSRSSAGELSGAC